MVGNSRLLLVIAGLSLLVGQATSPATAQRGGSAVSTVTPNPAAPRGEASPTARAPLAPPGNPAPTPTMPPVPPNQVVTGFPRVVDGESIDALVNGQRTAIRLLGVDAPMANTPCGQEATALLRSLTRNTIRLESVPGLTVAARKTPYDVLGAGGASLPERLA
jgi:endonuclease YncB( thermonuclease family)